MTSGNWPAVSVAPKSFMYFLDTHIVSNVLRISSCSI